MDDHSKRQTGFKSCKDLSAMHSSDNLIPKRKKMAESLHIGNPSEAPPIFEFSDDPFFEE